MAAEANSAEHDDDGLMFGDDDNDDDNNTAASDHEDEDAVATAATRRDQDCDSEHQDLTQSSQQALSQQHSRGDHLEHGIQTSNLQRLAFHTTTETAERLLPRGGVAWMNETLEGKSTSRTTQIMLRDAPRGLPTATDESGFEDTSKHELAAFLEKHPHYKLLSDLLTIGGVEEAYGLRYQSQTIGVSLAQLSEHGRTWEVPLCERLHLLCSETAARPHRIRGMIDLMTRSTASGSVVSWQALRIACASHRPMASQTVRAEVYDILDACILACIVRDAKDNDDPLRAMCRDAVYAREREAGGQFYVFPLPHSGHAALRMRSGKFTYAALNESIGGSIAALCSITAERKQHAEDLRKRVVLSFGGVTLNPISLPLLPELSDNMPSVARATRDDIKRFSDYVSRKTAATAKKLNAVYNGLVKLQFMRRKAPDLAAAPAAAAAAADAAAAGEAEAAALRFEDDNDMPFTSKREELLEASAVAAAAASATAAAEAAAATGVEDWAIESDWATVLALPPPVDLDDLPASAAAATPAAAGAGAGALSSDIFSNSSFAAFSNATA